VQYAIHVKLVPLLPRQRESHVKLAAILTQWGAFASWIILILIAAEIDAFPAENVTLMQLPRSSA